MSPYFPSPVEGILKMVGEVYPNQLDLLSINMGERLEAYGTSVVDNHYGFVQLTNQQSLESMAKVDKYIATMFDSPEKDPMLGVGQPVFGMFHDNNWYRAIITEILNEEHFRIFFVDYGNEAITKREYLRYVPEEILKIAPCAVQITMLRDNGQPFSQLEVQILKNRFEEKDVVGVVSDIQFTNGRHDINITLRLFFDGKEPDQDLMRRLSINTRPGACTPFSDQDLRSIDAIDSHGAVKEEKQEVVKVEMKIETLKPVEVIKEVKPTLPLYVPPHIDTPPRMIRELKNSAPEVEVVQVVEAKTSQSSKPPRLVKFDANDQSFDIFYNMIAEGYCTDVEFLVGRKHGKFRGHKLVFIARAPRFKHLEETNGVGKPIDLSILSTDAFQLLVKYIYGQEIELGPKMASGLQKAARVFGITPLFNLAGEYCEDLTDDNVVSYMESGHETSFAYMIKKFVEVSKYPDFKNMSHNNMALLLASDELVGKEIEIFQALMLWANYQTQKEKNFGLSLRQIIRGCVSLIRFPLMTLKEFSYGVVPTQILTAAETLSIFTAIGLEPEDRGTLDLFCKWQARVGRELPIELESPEIASVNAYWFARETQLRDAFLRLINVMDHVTLAINQVVMESLNSLGLNYQPYLQDNYNELEI